MDVRPLNSTEQKERRTQDSTLWILALSVFNDLTATPTAATVGAFLCFPEVASWELGAECLEGRPQPICQPSKVVFCRGVLTAAAGTRGPGWHGDGSPGGWIRKQTLGCPPPPARDSAQLKARSSQPAGPRSKVTLCKKDKSCPTQCFEDSQLHARCLEIQSLNAFSNRGL